MTRELVDRMRTCAAAIRTSQETGNPWNTSGIIAADAMNLLTEAANALDAPEPLGEPMALLEPQPAPPPPETPQDVLRASLAASWGGDLPTVRAQPCPSCGSVDARTVTRIARGRLKLTCPACGNNWEYR